MSKNYRVNKIAKKIKICDLFYFKSTNTIGIIIEKCLLYGTDCYHTFETNFPEEIDKCKCSKTNLTHINKLNNNTNISKL